MSIMATFQGLDHVDMDIVKRLNRLIKSNPNEEIKFIDYTLPSAANPDYRRIYTSFDLDSRIKCCNLFCLITARTNPTEMLLHESVVNRKLLNTKNLKFKKLSYSPEKILIKSKNLNSFNKATVPSKNKDMMIEKSIHRKLVSVMFHSPIVKQSLSNLIYDQYGHLFIQQTMNEHGKLLSSFVYDMSGNLKIILNNDPNNTEYSSIIYYKSTHELLYIKDIHDLIDYV